MSAYAGPWYSQRGEDKFIVQFFSRLRKGFFADLGATDGEFFSNTRALYNLGWRGFCLEADPAQCGRLVQLYRDEPTRVHVVSGAIVPVRYHRLSSFWAGGGGTSTMDDEHARIWAAEGDKFKQIFVATVTIYDVMQRFPAPWDFLSIDLEKLSWDVLKDVPLGDLGVRLLCVEFDDNRREIIEHCAKYGLKLRKQTDENLLLALD